MPGIVGEQAMATLQTSALGVEGIPGLPRRRLAPGLGSPSDPVENIHMLGWDTAFQKLLAPEHLVPGQHSSDLPLLVMPMLRCAYATYALVDTVLALVAGFDERLESSVI